MVGLYQNTPNLRFMWLCHVKRHGYLDVLGVITLYHPLLSAITAILTIGVILTPIYCILQ